MPVHLSHDGSLCTVELDRRERHNAFDEGMVAALATASAEVAAAVAEGRTRCVVIAGAGRSFSTGADLALLERLDVDGLRRFMLDATASFRRLAQLPVAVVAAVNGYCLGGGFELLLHCDLAIAAEDATFGLPESGIGLVTTAGSVARLMAAVGSRRARDLLVTGRRIDAREAHAMGLISEVVSAADLPAATRARAAALAALPAAGVGAMKRLVAGCESAQSDASWARELETFVTLLATRKGAGHDR